MEAEVLTRSADLENKEHASTSAQGDAVSKSNIIKLGLEKNISETSRQKIYSILDDASKLSDVEKLLLYLKLPTGVAQCSNTTGSETGFQRDEHQKALRWLRTHLEEDTSNCVQKQELYEEYRTFCDRHKYKCVNQFDFGKLLRQLFPRLKLRHLGQRGQSKTCYGGLKNCDELKPLTIEKLDIAEEEGSKDTTDKLGDDSSITHAACQLVCEWAQKLHENKLFPNIQELAEHLINSCVVSTHSTAAFTIIAAAQREDRNIVLDNQTPTQASTSSNGGEQSVAMKSTLQPKTHLQLQRTLKGRKMIREQKEKMEGRASKPLNNTMHEVDLPVADLPKQENKEKVSTGLKKPQKHILPKCSIVTDITPTVNSRQQGLRVQLPAQVPAMVTSSQPVFVLPSTPNMSQVAETTQIIRPHQMVILSPVKHTSKSAVTFAKERVPAAQPVVTLNTATKTSVVPATTRPNSTLAMLLTEQLDNTLLSHNDVGKIGNSNMEPSAKLLRSSSVDQSSAVRSPGHAKLRPGVTIQGCEPCSPTTAGLQVNSSQPLFVISGNDPTNKAKVSSGIAPISVLSVPSQTSHMMLTAAEPSPPSSTLSEQGSQSTTSQPNTNKANRAKKKLTPLKSRQSSKTVSTLLKETRGYGPLIDMKGFVNDRRPVAQLLKECRKRRTSGDDSNNKACIVIAPAAGNAAGDAGALRSASRVVGDGTTVPGQTVTRASATQLVLANQRGMASTISSMQDVLEPMDDVLVQNMLSASNAPYEDSNIKTEILYNTPRGTPHGTPQGTPNATPIHFSGHTQMPCTKNSVVLAEDNAQFSDLMNLDQAVSNESFQYFGKLISLPNNVTQSATNQDNNNNQDDLPIQDKSSRYQQQNNHDRSHQNTNVSALNNNWRQENKVNVNNIENDALNEYLANELSSDLADITPSLTMDSQTGSEQQDLGSTINLATVTSDIVQTDVNTSLSNQALVMQNSDPFIGFESSVSRIDGNNQSIPTSAREHNVHQYSQRPASELINHNMDMYNMPVTNLARPNTMPPELNILYSGNNHLQNYLTQTQPSVSVVDQNSTDSFSGYNTPGQMTPASQPTLTRSPSLCSAPSTPSSMLSPPERFTSSEPTNSFMPIQGNNGTLQLDQVSPIRPMVRNIAGSHLPSHKNPSSKAIAHAALVKQLPNFINPAAPVNFGGSFVPYNTPDSETPVQNVAHQQQNNVSFQQDSFLPASSIRPVKRLMATSQPGTQKRVRHRSAQDAKSLSKARAKNNRYNMLTSLLKAGPSSDGSSIQALCEAALHVRHNNPTSRRPTTLPKPLSFDESLQNSSNPQSPFSPEMQDIMAGETYDVTDGQDPLATNIFRSHSVPAQSLQRAVSETPDFAPPQIFDQIDDITKGTIAMDMGPLMDKQVKAGAEVGATQIVEFGARRNLNNLLQDEASGMQQFYHTSVRGDHMISGASVRNSLQQQQMNQITHQILAAQRAQRAVSYPGHVVPTPPSSQTPTPDFSAELSTLGDNSTPFSLGRVASSTIVDTPNSLGTLTPQDSRESLKEDMLVGMCDESDVIAMQPGLRQPQTQWPAQQCQWGPS